MTSKVRFRPQCGFDVDMDSVPCNMHSIGLCEVFVAAMTSFILPSILCTLHVTCHAV